MKRDGYIDPQSSQVAEPSRLIARRKRWAAPLVARRCRLRSFDERVQRRRTVRRHCRQRDLPGDADVSQVKQGRGSSIVSSREVQAGCMGLINIYMGNAYL